MDNATPTSTPATWPVLSLHERRVLGVMVEKAKTTPDVYPLTLNSLLTGCNQKSNRDPVMDMTDVDVEEALLSCQKKGLAIRITGTRVEKWRHYLYEAWHADKVELAILAELLLRGPQTEGELRGRASRMEPIEDLDSLRARLKPLAERRLVVYLTPEGRRGTTLTHGFHAPEELKALRSRSYSEEGVPVSSAPTQSAQPASVVPNVLPGMNERIVALEAKLERSNQEIAGFKQVVEILQNQVADLTKQFAALKESLGG